MNSRKLVGMFFKTLTIGGLAGLIISFFVKAGEYAKVLSPFDALEFLGLLVFFVGLGLVFAVVSQTGFFAYLFINRLGLSVFRSFWPTVQILLIAFVVFDLVYFPYQAAEGEIPLYLFILMSAAILVYGWIIAKIKAKETNQRAFIPALFLMVVMTTIEWVPGLRTSGTDYAWLMIIPLLACNTYQLLILHRLTRVDSEKQSANKGKGSPANKRNAAQHKKIKPSKI
ncbi:KinB-signaling pathway activation protein [Virgibacillus alimentarius]|uniref:KinB signaling pathway activation protein n=1 Tax=Virgibacillus alimentarius TaxID=698769 RepID=A0ABS4SDH8_9BACI|nr:MULTISPECIES: KinB-signaling pathway activation protein [Virgibacillus]MBP2259156.1 KinB signaling pathway activation protein [Virgibacillus alimentarius]HLR68591.1 KinB-signaling pathway activation protein [Virgibacillus sp.]